MNIFKILKSIITLGVGGLCYVLFFAFDYSDFSWTHNKSNYIFGLTCVSIIIAAISSYGMYQKGN